MDLSREPILALARSPSAGAPVVLARGRLLSAVLLVLAATLISGLGAVRLSSETFLDDFFFGATRHPVITAMLQTLGTERTAVVIYLAQRSFDAVLVATAVTPIFVWLLGSSAVQASARLAGIRRPYLPLLVFFGYASALTLIPANAATLALGTGPTLGAQLAQLIGLACLVWLGVIAYRGVRAYYAADRALATRILIVALVLFYIVPLILIVGAAVSIIVAAVILGYF
ncbi:MAG TPA: hypothetical protein VGR85_13230 [Candidatus Limnocylindria bacterium]|jgi:hypothetical protein|nr:hypothetical protein [Candidatus Limnocylindria bacterium]